MEKKKFFLFGLETVCENYEDDAIIHLGIIPKRSVFESTVFEQEQHLIDSRSIWWLKELKKQADFNFDPNSAKMSRDILTFRHLV